MGKKETRSSSNTSQIVTLPFNYNLSRRNKALLYVLGGFSILLYLVSFVRMGQW